MWSVTVATLPVIAASAYVYGAAVWQQLAILTAAALATEICCLRWRRRPLHTAADGSALVAAFVLAVALPPQAPWFVAVMTAVAAIALAKHCYGGLGNNPFNPAMVGYALAFFAFPAHFTAWHGVDAVSNPTPLAAARIDEVAADDGALLIAAASAIGGLPLLALGFADWRLPLAFALGAIAVHAGDEWRQLAYGGLVFTAFFVVTDPVTAATSRRGRWCYGFLVGALAMWLRRHGAHSDGIAFAVLIGNMLAPLCDLAVEKWRR